MRATTALSRLEEVLVDLPTRIVACSGGVDSLVLATVAHRATNAKTLVAHAVSAAVPAAATARVVTTARSEGWSLELVESGELEDESYLANPTDRCYHCKTHLYDELDRLANRFATRGAQVISGANQDDLGEYRPGLIAATEHAVRHPYVEAGLGKAEVREIARELGLSFAELPASPCLASRLYTGTRVSETRLRAVEIGEELIRSIAGVEVVRCRVRGEDVLVEVPDADRESITDELLGDVLVTMRTAHAELAGARLDDRAYRPGRAVLTLS